MLKWKRFLFINSVINYFSKNVQFGKVIITFKWVYKSNNGNMIAVLIDILSKILLFIVFYQKKNFFFKINILMFYLLWVLISMFIIYKTCQFYNSILFLIVIKVYIYL